MVLQKVDNAQTPDDIGHIAYLYFICVGDSN
jgi:hypothetical protein